MPYASLSGVSVPVVFFSSLLGAQTALTTVRVASGLASPLYVTAPAGDEGRLFVVEQATGLIRIVRNGSVLAKPFLDVKALIQTGGERGLLGLAFHPKYGVNGRFFVNYTRVGDGATVVARYTVSAGDPDVAEAGSGAVVLGPIAQPFANHNGGCLQFGPDGFLYVGMGDGGSGGDPSCNAQRGDTLLGKMLRIDVEGSGYVIPPTNPFVNEPNFMDEIWATGLRNPWRFSFDRLNGDMYVGDVGQSVKEEISFQRGGSPGGVNFGWKIMEGTACYSVASCVAPVPCNDARLRLPIHEYDHAVGCSVTGGYVYRGCAIPDLRGTYFFADYCSAKIWSFRYSGGVTELKDRTAELAPGGGLSIASITSFGEDARGELYVVDGGGEVFRIVPRLSAPATDLGYAKVGGNGKPPRFDACGLLNGGNSAELRLMDAPSGRPAVLVVSDQSNPTAMFGGTLVPLPLVIVVMLQTTGEGKVEFTVPGGGGPFDAYAQFLIEDPGATMGVGFSNALKFAFLR